MRSKLKELRRSMPIFICSAILLALIIFTVFYMPVLAAEGPDEPYGQITPITAINQSMVVNASWLDDELLRIDVMDSLTGIVSSLAIRLSDIVADAGNSPYILVQAVDLDGNMSGIVRIDNPFYVPGSGGDNSGAGSGNGSGNGGTANNNGGGNAGDNANNGNSGNSGNNANSGTPPRQGLTPDGTGTVIDNVVTQNEIEFFTVFTEAGNEFFLVIDRQRASDNVYLLNAVTEADLMALAERDGTTGGTPGISAVPTPPPGGGLSPTLPPADSNGNGNNQEPPGDGGDTNQEPDEDSSRGGGINFILIALIVVGVGGAAYYFKIVRGRKKAAETVDHEDWDDWDGEDEDNYIDNSESDYPDDDSDEGSGEE